MRRPFFSSLILALGLLVLSSVPASAQDYLCDPGNEDCRARLIAYMDAEWEAMDVAFWFMEDAIRGGDRPGQAASVRVRVLMDPRANQHIQTTRRSSTRYRATRCANA